MKNVVLRCVAPERDFGLLADWFTLLEGETNTEASLHTFYAENNDRVTAQVAVDGQDQPLGFYWAERSRSEPDWAFVYLFVRPEERNQGIGSQLFAHAEQALKTAGMRKLRMSVLDTSQESVEFVLRRGFTEHHHSIGMELDFAGFDDTPWDALIERLKGEGFVFTSMEELGNTEEAQRQLYVLNDTASRETPGSVGESPWGSFEDFQKHVCQTDWYIPAGQKVVIDSATGTWAGMSAITRLPDNEYAYNLFTGVERSYRGRKLAQAVKTTALRFARDVLGAKTVHTHHNLDNAPIIAIDRKFGYVQTPGNYVMEKDLA